MTDKIKAITIKFKHEDYERLRKAYYEGKSKDINLRWDSFIIELFNAYKLTDEAKGEQVDEDFFENGK